MNIMLNEMSTTERFVRQIEDGTMTDEQIKEILNRSHTDSSDEALEPEALLDAVEILANREYDRRYLDLLDHLRYLKPNWINVIVPWGEGGLKNYERCKELIRIHVGSDEIWNLLKLASKRGSLQTVFGLMECCSEIFGCALIDCLCDKPRKENRRSVIKLLISVCDLGEVRELLCDPWAFGDSRQALAILDSFITDDV